jgi:hypothetical protein
MDNNDIDVTLYHHELNSKKRFRTDVDDSSVYVTDLRRGKKVSWGRYTDPQDALRAIESDKRSGYIAVIEP